MKHTVKLSNGAVVPAIGQGTWYIGERTSKRAQEIDAIRAGIEAGMTLVDTAEMYGNGLSENRKRSTGKYSPRAVEKISAQRRVQYAERIVPRSVRCFFSPRYARSCAERRK